MNLKLLKNSSLRLSRSTLGRWRRKGIITAKYVAGRICYDVAQLLCLLCEHYDGEPVNMLKTTLEDWCCAFVASGILLGATPRQMQSLRAMGLLPSSKIGRKRFYLKRDCEALREQRHIRFCITHHERIYKLLN